MFRGDGRTHATDAKALETAGYAVERALDRELPPFQRMFLYMPFMHSENLRTSAAPSSCSGGWRRSRARLTSPPTRRATWR
jgi:uncharacterized protein (DUF924 family)